MKSISGILFCAAVVSVLLFCQTENREFPVLKGPYLGQRPPEMAPEIFAPGILSSQQHPHGSLAFSNDGRSIYWSAMLKDGP